MKTSTVIVIGAVVVGGVFLLRRQQRAAGGASGGAGGFLSNLLGDATPVAPNFQAEANAAAGGGPGTNSAATGYLTGGIKGAVIGGSFLAAGPLGPLAITVGPKVLKGAEDVWNKIF